MQINMKNLIKALTNEANKQHNEFTEVLRAESDIKTMLDKWQYSNLLPSSKKGFKWANVQQLKDYLLKRAELRRVKRIADINKRIELVNIANEDIERVVITLNWVKSAMWGSNPKAEAKVIHSVSYGEYFESGSVSGCGYDKQSTAVANCLNQCNGLLKLLYLKKDKKVNSKNHELFGYGSGYGILPSIEGGVGVSCYNTIFNKIGYEFKTVSSGKAFDVYEITKISKKRK